MILTLPPARPTRPDSPQPAYAELGMRSNFSFLDGASHPAELAQRAKALGLAGFGLCDQQGLAGAVRGHVAAKEAGLRYAVGSRLTLEDGAQYLVWPTDRASYGRLTTLLSRGRMAAPKGECHLAREAFYEAAEGWVVAALPPAGWDGGDEAVALQARGYVALQARGQATPQARGLAMTPASGLAMPGVCGPAPANPCEGPPSGPRGVPEAPGNTVQQDGSTPRPSLTLVEARHTFPAQLHRDAQALRHRTALPLFLAASATLGGDDRRHLNRLAAVAQAADARLLATNDVRYHHPSRRRLADVLTAIRLRTRVDALGFAAEPNGERHIKSPTEMARLFRDHPDAIADTLRVLDATSGFSLDQLRYEYPDELMEPGRTAQQTLTARVAEAMDARGSDPATRAQVAYELTLIEKLNYAPYFLTVHEIVRFARGRGILCQGRGSAANSAICYVLGVTAVDPSKHDLLFERFISENRGEPPDIDIDFEHERREEVIQHLYQRYGRERAAICATVIRYRTRSAIREVGRAMGLSEDVTAKLAKASWGPGREQTLAELAAAEGLDAADPNLAMTLELAEELQDFPRHSATHVGGFVITRGPLIELAVVTNAAMVDRTTLEWDKDDIEALGILKVDVLGLGMLSCLRRSLDLLRLHNIADHSLQSLPQDCPATYAMLRRADSLGVFQVESRAQMNMLPRLRPDKFYDLVIEVAIVRPGPIQGDMVHPYLRRKQGIEPVHYPSPAPEHGPADELERVLGKTLGVPLFQEQAMRLAIVAARFTPDEADQLRRSMATFKMTGGVTKYRDKLVQGMVRRGYEEEFATRVFSQIEGFGSYGFPESHAASFAQLVYASSWIKCHHPGPFAAALLNSQPMGFYAPAQIVRDAREHGVEVRPVDVNASDWDCTLEATGEGLALRLGLRMISGMQEDEVARLVAARGTGGNAARGAGEDVARSVGGHAARSVGGNTARGVGENAALGVGSSAARGVGENAAHGVGGGAAHGATGNLYTSVEDVAARAGVGKRALEGLAGADAFGSHGGQARRQALWAARGAASGLAALPLFAIRAQPMLADTNPTPATIPQPQDVPRATASGFPRATTSDANTHLLPEPAIHLPPETEGEAAVADYTALGLSLGRHPLAMLRDRLRAMRFDDTQRLNTARPGSWIRLPGLVLMRQRPGSAKGIVFLTVEDEFGVGNLVVYTDVAARDRQALVSARLMLAEGRVERETQHAEVPITHLLVRRLIDRSDLLRDLLVDNPGAQLAAHLAAPGEWAERSLSRADEVKRQEPGARYPGARRQAIPTSRDFR